MGELEKTSKKRRRKQNMQKIVLGTIFGAGFLSIALVAPNAVKSIEKFIPKSRQSSSRYAAKRSLNRLIEKGFVRLEKTSKGTFVRLTKEGEKQLHSLDYGQVLAYQSRKRWDKKWRVVIFDIKEERRWLRDKLRRTLNEIGFYKLQQSVWVYPYDCEDLIKMLKADYRIGKDVLYIIADTIENDGAVKEHFGLN